MTDINMEAMLNSLNNLIKVEDKIVNKGSSVKEAADLRVSVHIYVFKY